MEQVQSSRPQQGHETLVPQQEGRGLQQTLSRPSWTPPCGQVQELQQWNLL
jgi:hypothetical protein